MRQAPKERIPPLYFDLRDALEHDGCPFCRLLARDVQSYLSNLLYENVNDGDVRSKLRQSFGVCRLHARILTELGDPLGVAILYQDILQEIRESLAARTADQLSPHAECPACSYRSKFEKMYVETLAHHLQDAELDRLLENSRGLCMHHLSQVMEHVDDEGLKNRLLLLHERKLDALRKSLSEYVRKQDIQFKNELISPEEESACERAIAFLVGKND